MLNRLLNLERGIERHTKAAPTFPKYDSANAPQDLLEGQIAIGADHSLMCVKDGVLKMFTPGGSIPTDLPQDAVEGQIAIGNDTRLYGYCDGQWYGWDGGLATGNPPQDAVNGQLVVGNSSPCWRVGDKWYCVGGGDSFLVIYGDRYNGLPGLHYTFPFAVSEAWLRFTIRNDVITLPTTAAEVVGLVFEEVLTDPYYSGSTPTDKDSSWNFVQDIQINFANDLGASWSAHIFNTSNLAWNSQGGDPIVHGVTTLGAKPIIDLHVKFFAAYTPLAGYAAGGTWLIEVYKDGVLVYQSHDSIFGDNIVSFGNHPIGTGNIGALTFHSQYGNYSIPRLIGVDDISCGTTQGGTDLMPVQNFSDGTLGQLIDASFDSVSNPTFQVFIPVPPAPFPFGHPLRLISGASGFYDDDNTSVTPDTDYIGNGIFYKWIAPANGDLIIRTDNSGVSAPPDIDDTKLYLFDATPTQSTDNSVDFNDDDHGPSYGGSAFYSLIDTSIDFGPSYIIAGHTYYFLVNGFSISDIGTYKLSWNLT